MQHQTTKHRTPKTARDFQSLAADFAMFLARRGLMDETAIYAHGRKISCDGDSKSILAVPGPDGEPFVKLHVLNDVTCPCEYANPDTMTATYEGSLYDVMNSEFPSMRSEIDKFFEARGLYVEPCWPWAFTLGVI